MVKIIWTKKALNQYERVLKFIHKEQGKPFAKTVGERILNAVELLANYPKTGTNEPLLKHKKSEYRFLIIWSYKVIYRNSKDKVIISRLFHTSQNPKKIKEM